MKLMWFPLEALKEAWSRSFPTGNYNQRSFRERARERDNKTSENQLQDIWNRSDEEKTQRSQYHGGVFFPLKLAGGASVIGKEMDRCVMMCFHHHVTEHLLSEVLL